MGVFWVLELFASQSHNCHKTSQTDMSSNKAAEAAAAKEDAKRRQVIIILEQAALETVKTSKGYQLLNCDDHKSIHKKFNKDPTQSRPDILHQELMAVLDSPLNKAGFLKVRQRP